MTLTLSSAADETDPQARRFSVQADPAAAVSLICEQSGDAAERHRLRSNPAVRHTIALHGLKAGTTYTCAAEGIEGALGESEPVTFTTDPLPSDLAVPRIAKSSTDPLRTGYILFNVGTLIGTSTYVDNYLVILDPRGNVRWYFPGIGGGDMDVTWLGDNRVLYGGFGGDPYAPTIVGLDKQVQWRATYTRVAPTEVEGSWHHDAGISADGTSVFTFTEQNIDDVWEGFIIRQIDLASDEVVWTWDSYVDGVGSGGLPPGADFDRDPYHANTIYDRWEDGRLYLYVSMKQLGQVAKIDYLTKEVVWLLGIDGDFTLLEEDGTEATNDRWFFYQHDAKVIDNRMYIYDNGTERIYYGGKDYSRALELELDTKAMTARIVGEWSEPGWAEPIWGGYDPGPEGSSLVAIGHCWPCDVVEGDVPTEYFSALVELDASRNETWRANFPDSRSGIYRAQRIDGCDIFNLESMCRE